MARGTLAYAEYDFNRYGFRLKTSDEFNSDMGVGMANGKKTMKRLAAAQTPDHFEKVVYDTVHDFGYEDDYDSEDPADMMDEQYLDEGVGVDPDKPFKITDGVLKRTFNYSDYEYIAAYRSTFYIEDRKGRLVEVVPGNPCVFCFGEYIGVVDANGNFIDESNEEKEEE